MIVAARPVDRPLAVRRAASAAEGTGVLQGAVRSSQDRLVAGVVPHLPAPTPIQVRTFCGLVACAFAGVDDGLLASSPPEVTELVDVSGLVPNDPAGNGVCGVVPVPDHHILGVKAGVAASVTSWESKYTL